MKDARIQQWVCVREEGLSTVNMDDLQGKSLCVHCTAIPVCSVSRQPILKPVLASDGFIYDEDYLKAWLQRTNHSRKTKTLFPSTNYYPVRLAVCGELSSKLDARMKFSALMPVVVVFRCQTNNNSVVLMVERQNEEHGTGFLTVYRLSYESNHSLQSKAKLEISTVDDLAYAQADTKTILQRYGLDVTTIQAISYQITEEKRVKLDALARHDAQLAEQGKIIYCHRAEKAFINFYALFTDVRYSNACSWVRGLLKRTEILTAASLHYDRCYQLVENRVAEFFLGATPDRVFITTPVAKDAIQLGM